MSSRYAKLVVIVGVRGCGKTTLVRKLIEHAQKLLYAHRTSMSGTTCPTMN